MYLYGGLYLCIYVCIVNHKLVFNNIQLAIYSLFHTHTHTHFISRIITRHCVLFVFHSRNSASFTVDVLVVDGQSLVILVVSNISSSLVYFDFRIVS